MALFYGLGLREVVGAVAMAFNTMPRIHIPAHTRTSHAHMQTYEVNKFKCGG